MTHPYRTNTNWPSSFWRMPQHGTIRDSLYNAFSFGLFAASELESGRRTAPETHQRMALAVSQTE
jgi:hypothetical protein